MINLLINLFINSSIYLLIYLLFQGMWKPYGWYPGLLATLENIDGQYFLKIRSKSLFELKSYP